ncbi:MAG: 50S ribosomal protein L23 [Armatimonadetes bacterium]|nr:50S ribosomal protein L23 [Armatimonadota bacterium]
MKDPHVIILRPHITERSVALSYGDPNATTETAVRRYTFVVAKDANKIEIKAAVEAIYNAGKGKKDAKIEVTKVATISMKGKSRRVGQRSSGKKPDWKKAIITLAPGQLLEDYGV